MNKTTVGGALDYPNFTKLLVFLGAGILLVSGYLNLHIAQSAVVIFFATMPLTLTVALRSESLSYATEFRRSWADWVMENTNNFLLIGGIATFVYGLVNESFIFAAWLGLIYIVTISLAMWVAWKVARKISASQK